MFSGLQPTNDLNDNLGCQVGNSASQTRVLVLTAQFDGSDAAFRLGASSTRVTKNSVLTVRCFGEDVPFNFNSDPLRIDFTRLASMTVQHIEPDSVG